MFDVIVGDSKNFITYNSKKRKLLFHHTYERSINIDFEKVRIWNSIESKNLVKIIALSDRRIVKEYFVGDNLKNIIDPKFLENYFSQSINTLKKIYAYYKRFPAITEKSIIVLPKKFIKFKEFISFSYKNERVSFTDNLKNIINIFKSTAENLDYHSVLFDDILYNNLDNIADLLKDIDEYFYKNPLKNPKSNENFLFPPLFVGRKKELSILNKYFDEAISKKEGLTILVSGGKGVGKTRLTLEFLKSKKDIIRAHSRATDRDFSSLFSLLESFEVLNEGLLTEGDLKVLRNIIKLLPSGKSSVSSISNVERISFEISKFLKALSRPIIVSIDDFDQIDEKSFAVLKTQTRLSKGLPILLLINTQKKQFFEKMELLDKFTIELKNLTNFDTEVLIQSLLGENDFADDDFVKWISSVSNNVPLNVIEIIKYISNSYQIFLNKDGVWTTSKDNPEDFNIPSELNDMILDSYSSLDSLEKKILNYIVSDQEGFNAEELINISKVNKKDLEIALQSLVKKNFIISNRKNFVCSSASIRKSLYSKIKNKKTYHKNILKYLVKNQSLSIRIVDHYMKADMIKEAAETLLEYSRELFYLGKVDYAADAMEGLFVLYNKLNRPIKNIKAYAMEIFSRAGRYQEMLTVYSIGGTTSVFSNIFKLRALVHLNKASEAAELAKQLEFDLVNYGNIIQFKILNELAYMNYRFGDLDKALDYIDKMDKINKEGFSRHSYIEFYKIKAIIYSSIGYKNKKYFDLSKDIYNIVLKLSKIENDLINEAIVYNNLGSMLMYDDNNTAKKYLGEAANLFNKAENIYLKSYPLSNLAMIRFVSGQTVMGMRTIDELIAMGKNFGWKYDYIEFLKIKAQMYFFAEDMKKTLDVIEIIMENLSSNNEKLVFRGQSLLVKIILNKHDFKPVEKEIEDYFSHYEENKTNVFYMVWYFYLKAQISTPTKGAEILKEILNYKDILENFPFQLYNDISTLYIRAGKLEEAENTALKLLKISSDGGAKLFEAKANALLGYIAAKRGYKKDAFIKFYNAKTMFKLMFVDNLVNYCDMNIEKYSLAPSLSLNEIRSLHKKVESIKKTIDYSENMLYSLMDDTYTLKTFINTIFTLGKELDINNFASSVVDQTLGLFGVNAAAFYIAEDNDYKLLFAKDYQENVYDNFVLPKSLANNYDKNLKIVPKERYIYVPIVYGNQLKAFLYMQTDTVKDKLTNFERELLLMLPDSLSLILQHVQLYSMAIYDPLTKLYTRNYFVSKIQKDFKEAKNYNLEYTIMMLDIDDFKKFNDTYGHTTGDIVLKKIASTIESTVGDLGTVGRFGGEEFIITLPIGYLSSSVIADKINKAVNKIKIDKVKETLSISIGIASHPYTEVQDYLELIDKADEALYITKNSGKNSYTLYEKKLVSE